MGEGIALGLQTEQSKVSEAKHKFAKPRSASMARVRNTTARPSEFALMNAPPKGEPLDKHNAQAITMFLRNVVGPHRR